ncbi:MAG: putative sulfate/molybdate transporter, partial [Armatimonadota bacterium]
LHCREMVPQWEMPRLVPRLPTGGEMMAALTALTIPQLPLTLGNAVVATCDAASKYFPNAANRVTPRRICASLAVANLTAGWLGGMPVCHGSGGLTAHYKLGARTWRANLVIGSALVGVAVMLGRDAVPLFTAFPRALLSALLAYVGVQHSLLARGLPSRASVVTAGTVGVVGALTGNLLIGMIVGTAAHWLGAALGRHPTDVGKAGSD